MLKGQAEIYGAGDPQAYREALKRFYPQGARTRFATPEEIAAFIFAVAGIEAITGAATMASGSRLFCLYNADGTPVSISHSREAALASAGQQELTAMTVH